MKTMRLYLIAAVLLAGAALVSQGCDTNIIGLNSGSKVVFSATAAAPATKTAYSGEIVNGYERIDWKGNDKIRIYSPEATVGTGSNVHWADYAVIGSSIEDFGNKSEASLQNLPGANGLVWDYTHQTNTFYAVYPSSRVGEGEGLVQGAQGNLVGSIPARQSRTESGDMKYAYMFAKKTVSAGSNVRLEFEPAFTAFEISFYSEIEQPLYLGSFTISSASKAMAGEFKVNCNGTNIAYDCTDSDQKGITVPLNDALLPTEASNSLKLTVLSLPQTMYDDLTITFNVKTSASATTYQTRTLELKKANGDAVEFAGRAKHRITGVALNASVWNFETITLKGDVIGWTIVDDDDIHYNSNDSPQATQFAVFGDDVKNVYDLHHNDAGKDYRQHWVIGSGSAAFTFQVYSPVGGTYKIVACGATGKYDIQFSGTTDDDGDGQGGINDPRTGTLAVVNVVITPKNGSNAPQPGEMVWFKTYVTDSAGITYSLDSETQLYDMRGYHYFRIDDPLR